MDWMIGTAKNLDSKMLGKLGEEIARLQSWSERISVWLAEQSAVHLEAFSIRLNFYRSKTVGKVRDAALV